MSAGVDLSQFFDTFFDEADELLADMERLLLGLDVDQPDSDDLNGIFRAAHSIKGGAGTFGCFDALTQTTHLLENILDQVRRGDMALRKEMIDLFLETKDVLAEQVAAYRSSGNPDAQAYERICAQLRELALANQTDGVDDGVPAMQQAGPLAPAPASTSVVAVAVSAVAGGKSVKRVDLTGVASADAQSLITEMALLGEVVRHEDRGGVVSIWLETPESADDITAVCCFVVNADQVRVTSEGGGFAAEPVVGAQHPPAPPVAGAPAPGSPLAPEPTSAGHEGREERRSGVDRRKTTDSAARKESGTIRVGVEKVDQIINLVGELVITQAMLVQAGSELDPVVHDRLLNGIEQLERNARDLQEAVMSVRMMPMDYVFSRFPRVVRENASRLGKRIRLVTQGEATELDKSLIERIIDPLTHLVRNSLDHGIEAPDVRLARGKNPEGCITLSAQHNGGQIIIEVSDDGAGLDRRRILAKAASQGMAVSDTASDEEVWQLIFAPGFSTAEKITDISGRGVGMDVVRRNIQDMGGHIQLSSREGRGTIMRIALPLTLAILDGMSVKVGNETFILPLSHVTESMQPTTEQIHHISEGEQLMYVRGEYLPIVALHEVFSVEGAQTNPTGAIAVILQAEDARFALLVDQLVGQHQVVVKNLESNYRKIPGVSAATILGDGSVALIVDVFALMRMTRETA
ncbi:MAG TPA: chemotaxis protein CheA [Burkholderiaceae bacterium]|nr:chemotaxis protein CheA [Burkholderiaceae bacterium]